ncbi:putative ribonuclease H-like domain-containing protein [Tanacetum coccineum]
MKKMYFLVVIDDYSRFTWVFFLATKDEKSGILKSFITGIENLVDHKVKVIRCDNRTEFKNREMNKFVNPKISHDDGSKPSSDDGKKVDKDPRKESECNDQEKEDNINSTNNVNTVSLTVNAAGTNKFNAICGKTCIKLPFDLNMPALEDYSIFDFSIDDEDDGVVADMNNLDTTIQQDWLLNGHTQEEGIDYDEVFAPVARIEAIRLFLAYASFKDFVVYQMDVKSVFLYGNIEEEVYVCQPPGFEDPDIPDRVYKVEKSLYGLYQAPRAWDEHLVATYLFDVDDIIFGLTKMSYDGFEEKLMHEKFQMSSNLHSSWDYKFTEVKTASTPMETQKPLLKDEDGEEVDVHMYRSMIGSLMYLTSSRPDIMFAVCACARYQVNPKVSHLHAVKRIFRYLKGQPKLGLWYPKDSPFDLVAYTDSDYAGASLDRKSTTGGCQFLGCIMAVQEIDSEKAKKNVRLIMEKLVVKENRQSDLVRKRIKRVGENKNRKRDATFFGELYLMGDSSTYGFCNVSVSYKPEVQFFSIHFESMVKETWICGQIFDVFIGISGGVTLIFNPGGTTIKKERADVQAMPMIPITHHHYSLNISIHTRLKNLGAEQDNGNINKTQSKATPNEPSSPGTSSGGGPMRQETMGDTIAQTRSENVSKLSNDPLLARGNTLRSGEDSLKLNELMELCTNLQTRVLDLETTKTTQANEIASLKRMVKKLEKKNKLRNHKLKRLYKVGLSARVESSRDEESLSEDASKQGRRITDIDDDEDIILVNDQIDADTEMFDVDTLTSDEVLAEQVVDAKDVNLSVDEVTLAQALAALKSAKVQEKGDGIKEPSVPVSTVTTSTKDSVATTTTATIPTPRKGIVFQEPEPEKLMKKKELIRIDEEIASKLQAKLDEEVRLAREKVEKEQEANQEEFSDAEKATLFVQLLEKRRNHFAAKRAEEKRNKPPTQAQQRKIMCTYLKNMEGKKPKDLKNKSFDSIQKMFDRAFKRVNTFVDFRTDLMEGSSKRAEEELEQESSKKQKLDDDKETTELKSLMEVILDKEDVALDAIPLAVKSPSIVDSKIHKEGKKSYYQIIRVDGSSKMT